MDQGLRVSSIQIFEYSYVLQRFRSWGFRVLGFRVPRSSRLPYTVIREYSSKYIGDPIRGLFLRNPYGTVKALNNPGIVKLLPKPETLHPQPCKPYTPNPKPWTQTS